MTDADVVRGPWDDWHPSSIVESLADARAAIACARTDHDHRQGWECCPACSNDATKENQ